MAAAEGYGDHVMHALGSELLPSYARIDEAMRRYREGEEGDPVFERLLGIEMKREQYADGRAFCDTVVELTDEATLTADVGLGRRDALAPRDRRAAPVARAHRLRTTR